MKRKLIYLLLCTTALMFTACSSEDTSETVIDTPDTKSFSGVIVDGYISGATVCLDTNVNGTCESTEPSTTTAQDGTFSFTGLELADGLLLPVIAQGGVDTATNQPFNGELKNIIDFSSVSADEPLIVTPLTDLIAVSFLQAPTKDTEALTNSKAEVAEVFNLSVDEVSTDPMTSLAVFAKTQEVQQMKALIETVALKAQDTNTSTPELRSDITKALVTQIKTTNTTLDVEQVMTEVESLAEITIPENEKVFVVAQVQEIQTTMTTLAEDNTIQVDTLDEIQAGLEAEQEVVLETLELATADEVIETVTLSSIETLITTGEEIQATFPDPVEDTNESSITTTVTVPNTITLATPPAVPTL